MLKRRIAFPHFPASLAASARFPPASALSGRRCRSAVGLDALIVAHLPHLGLLVPFGAAVDAVSYWVADEVQHEFSEALVLVHERPEVEPEQPRVHVPTARRPLALWADSNRLLLTSCYMTVRLGLCGQLSPPCWCGQLMIGELYHAQAQKSIL